jgi:septum site-determining protein MinC
MTTRSKSKAAASPTIEFKSTAVSVFAALLRSVDLDELSAALQALAERSPNFFDGDAVVLDFSRIETPPLAVDWPALMALLRRYDLAPVGVRNLGEPLAAAAREAGLVLFPEQERASRPAAAPAAPPPQAAPTMVIDRPLRSGQQVYARGGDLVVLAMVSAGAEVIADGNIHVYAALRGRALAGARGDATARIFTTRLEAELVSIAGVYRTFEEGLAKEVAGRPAQIRLKSDADGQRQALAIEALAIA